MQEPRRVPSSEDDGMRLNLFFPGTCASEKTLLRPQTCELGTQTKPSEAGLFGRGGARERSDAWPSGRDERCGLCPDDVRCSGLHLFSKMLAFLREPVDFVDRLKPSRRCLEGHFVRYRSISVMSPTRRAWRPPSNSVVRKASTMRSARLGPTIPAPMASMLASLWRRVISAT